MKRIYLLIVLATVISCSNDQRTHTHDMKLPDGQTARIFQLQNKQGMSVTISEYGATILTIFTPDRNGNLEDIVAGYDSAETYVMDKSYFGSIVGRFANRIADGKFTLDSIEYTLNKNEREINHLHGGIAGLDKKLWKGIQQDQRVTLAYTSPDGEEGYPGNLEISVTYTLTDSNELHIDYSAKTDKPTVVNLSSHSYFNLSGKPDTGILDHQLLINADSFLTVNNNLIPEGKATSVINTPFDFRNPKAIGKDITKPDQQLVYANAGYDHNFVLNRMPRGNSLNFALKLTEPVSGRVLEIFTDQPGLQFYSGNFLDGSFAGKKGYRYKKYDALVFETQKFPDSPNHSSYPSTTLRPGELYTHHTILKFSVENIDN